LPSTTHGSDGWRKAFRVLREGYRILNRDAGRTLLQQRAIIANIFMALSESARLAREVMAIPVSLQTARERDAKIKHIERYIRKLIPEMERMGIVKQEKKPRVWHAGGN